MVKVRGHSVVGRGAEAGPDAKELALLQSQLLGVRGWW
jgi:hypothetical protein